MRILVATACDAAHYPLAADLVASLRAIEDRRFKIGFIQLGEETAPAVITDQVDEFRRASVAPSPGLGEGFVVAQYAIKARLPEFFPDYEMYVWLDGDTWVQNSAGIDRIVEAAQRADFCAHPQLDPNYFGCRYPDDYTISVYGRIFGQDIGKEYSRFGMINSGVIGARFNSPIWETWKALLLEISARQIGEPDRFFSDQIPLHYLIFSGRLSLYPLRAVDNWLVRHCTPRFDSASECLTAPSWPFEEINIIHLVGSSKSLDYQFGAGQPPLRYSQFLAWRNDRPESKPVDTAAPS